MRWFVLIGAGAAATLLALDFHASEAHEIPELEETYMQGVFSPKFIPPAAGTYDLPTIKRVPAVVLIDAAGRRVNTASLMRGKVAVVSFIYTACPDRLGCPLAGVALRELQAQLLREGLQDQAVLLSISLDPERDTPAQLTKYGRVFGAEPSFWHLLTAPSEQALQAALESYGQDRARVYDEDGRFTGRYRHVLKVFLVDREGQVRNIYSVGSLVPQVMVNDIKTVLAEKNTDRREAK
jgi:cytochrome c peroxidase